MSTVSPYFNVANEHGVQVVRFSRADVLDGTYIERLGDDLDKYVSGLESPKIVIDLNDAAHFSSTALGMLVRIQAIIQKRGGDMRIANVTKSLKKIFKLTNLHKILKMSDSVEKAAAELN